MVCQSYGKKVTVYYPMSCRFLTSYEGNTSMQVTLEDFKLGWEKFV